MLLTDVFESASLLIAGELLGQFSSTPRNHARIGVLHDDPL
jgi:hypothetical protein